MAILRHCDENKPALQGWEYLAELSLTPHHCLKYDSARESATGGVTPPPTRDEDPPAIPFVAAALRGRSRRCNRRSASRPTNSKGTQTNGRAAMHAVAADRDAARADANALALLNQELSRHRTSAEKSLAETRAQSTSISA